MAVEYMNHPTAFPCESCDCIDGIAPDKRWQIKGQPKTNICFRYATSAQSRFFVSLVSHYQNGHLYRNGGIENQPAIYLASMMFLTSYLRDDKN